MKYKIILLKLLSLVLFFGCGQSVKLNQVKSLSVDIDNSKVPQPKPKIKNGHAVGKEGPVPREDMPLYRKKNKKLPIVAIVFGPGIYKTLGHIPIIQELSKQKISIHIASGIGMGAMVAAMFANKMTAQDIEWRFYRFIRAIENIKTFSDEWMMTLDKLIQTTFEDMRIQDTQITLALPIYNKFSKLVNFSIRGKLGAVLLNNLSLSSNNSSNKKSPLMQNSISFAGLEDLGADIIIVLNVIQEEIGLKYSNSYAIGVYGRIAGKLSRMKNIINVKLSNKILDRTNGLSTIIEESKRQSEAVVEKINNIIKSFKNKEDNL